jgi:hypothetical protein
MHSLTVLFAVPLQLTENVVVDGIEIPASTSAVPKDPDAAPMVQLWALANSLRPQKQMM